MPIAVIIGIVLASLVLLVAIFILGQYLNIFLSALVSKAYISFPALIRMRLRGLDPREIAYARIRSVKAGTPVGARELQTHALAGGNVAHVVSAVIAANRACIDLTWDDAATLDLAGDDPLATVEAEAGGSATNA